MLFCFSSVYHGMVCLCIIHWTAHASWWQVVMQLRVWFCIESGKQRPLFPFTEEERRNLLLIIQNLLSVLLLTHTVSLLRVRNLACSPYISWVLMCAWYLCSWRSGAWNNRKCWHGRTFPCILLLWNCVCVCPCCMPFTLEVVLRLVSQRWWHSA
jgi:hypothetical protein